ncbi:transposase, partial [Candidatus Erwinia dacicola]
MADHSMIFSNTLAQLGGEDFLRELTEFMLNRIMEADVTKRINAEPHERYDERETYRNGYRDRTVQPGWLSASQKRKRSG